ncbi:hypothetical protein JJB09_25755 [Rhizobium sp. KVB221]|uniref:C-type lysozyme inhibitor domain-containing protein n=1 Tax=Rhizobium setariae TaxID=2801340 RepID=A0A936YRC3_9HYPH|nr:hypothetical protein [Rhizobium setariae]MBL0375419.1 hypothetical protein [Rhizobium setariae]
MVPLYRNETSGACSASRRRISSLVAAFLVFGVANAASAQDGEPMDEQDGVSVSCNDGTELLAQFTEEGVEVTLTDGQKVNLKLERDDDKGYSYTNGKFTLSGDDAGAKWTVGRKVPIACEMKDDSQPSAFDSPIAIDADPLAANKANPDAQPQVNCYRFPGFMVKEVDLGEKGAEKLAITPQNAACKKDAGKDEKVISDESAGYFLGAKGNLVFFQAPDQSNGGLPFVVYDATTAKRLFEDNLAGEDFDSITGDGSNLTLTFRRVYTADCSLYLDRNACGAAVKNATGLGLVAPLPDCGPAYDAEKKRTPDYAKEIEQLPSVISYQAELNFSGGKVNVKALEGETACSVPS